MITALDKLRIDYGEINMVQDNAVSHSHSFSTQTSSRRKRRRQERESSLTTCKPILLRCKASNPVSPTKETAVDNPIEFPLKDASCWESSPPVLCRRSLLAFMGLRMPQRCDSFDNLDESSSFGSHFSESNCTTADLIAGVLSDLQIADEDESQEDGDLDDDGGEEQEDEALEQLFQRGDSI